MDSSSVTPFIDQSTRDLLVPAAGTGIVYLILSGQPMTIRLAVGAMSASLMCGFFGAKAVATAFHLGPDWYSILGAGFGFVGHLALMGVIKLGELWRQDPSGFIARFLPFVQRKNTDG